MMSRYLDFIRDFRLGVNDFPTLSSTDIIDLLREHEPERFEDFQLVSTHLALDIQRVIAQNPYINVQDMFALIEGEMTGEVIELTEKHAMGNPEAESYDVLKWKLNQKLKEVIGLDEVKEFIHKLRAQMRIQQERKKLGLQTNGTQTLHMVFKGNPGTGKTTIARIVGELYYDLGILKSKKFVETDRSGLIGKYLGETAQKTKAKVEEALDGVLFIDEAYALNDSYSDRDGYGKEAIDMLVKCVEDYRDRLVVILAGYSKEMDLFMQMNPGLTSRFPNVIEFPDYEVEQLMEMASRLFANSDYEYTEKTTDKLERLFEQAKHNPQFGNGRYVRNVFETALRNQALRLDSLPILTREDLTIIVEQDIAG